MQTSIKAVVEAAAEDGVFHTRDGTATAAVARDAALGRVDLGGRHVRGYDDDDDYRRRRDDDDDRRRRRHDDATAIGAPRQRLGTRRPRSRPRSRY